MAGFTRPVVQVRRDPGKKGVTVSSYETRHSGHLDLLHVHGRFHTRVQRYPPRLVRPADAGEISQQVFTTLKKREEDVP